MRCSWTQPAADADADPDLMRQVTVLGRVLSTLLHNQSNRQRMKTISSGYNDNTYLGHVFDIETKTVNKRRQSKLNICV